LINSDKKDNIIKYAKGLTPLDIFEKISGIQEIRSNLKRYMNYQLAVDMLTLTT
jgi:DNA polymerase-3 subunit delta'